jgi:hypothetical protein
VWIENAGAASAEGSWTAEGSWPSSEDDWSDTEAGERVGEGGGGMGGSWREMQMSPSNLRPMTGNFEATEPENKEQERKKRQLAGSHENSLDQVIKNEELLAQRSLLRLNRALLLIY